MHNEMLQVEGKKMSKSLGNFFTVRDLLEQDYSGEVIRYVLLGTHYTKPIDWTTEKAIAAEFKLKDFVTFVELYADLDAASERGPSQALLAVLSDDLNTAGAITILNDHVNHARGDELAADVVFMGFETFESLGEKVRRHSPGARWLRPLAQRLHQLRLNAVNSRDFTAVDDLSSCSQTRVSSSR
jgi:cysteinyl-tRNA synthetase